MFLKNLADWDRIVRLLLGMASVSLVFWGPKSQWGWLGLALIATALLGHCPLYVMLGIRSCPPNHGKRTR